MRCSAMQRRSWKRRARRLSKFSNHLLTGGVLPVVTGFNGATIDGRATTLGRGGSDFSASILAAVLDASELWIWTDVDGIMSADPRSVPEARVLDALTYNEAAELAYNGAKVLHPRTLAPLIERQIPVWSKNSFHLEHPGTQIVSTLEAPPGPRAVTSMSNVALDFDRTGQRRRERHAVDGARPGSPGRCECGGAGAQQLQLPAEFLFPGPEGRTGSGYEVARERPGAGIDPRLPEASSQWMKTWGCWR